MASEGCNELMIDGSGISCEIALRGGMLLDFSSLLMICRHWFRYYRKTSSKNRTKSQNLNVSHFVLQLSLPNPLKPNVKLRMKM